MLTRSARTSPTSLRYCWVSGPVSGPTHSVDVPSVDDGATGADVVAPALSLVLVVAGVDATLVVTVTIVGSIAAVVDGSPAEFPVEHATSATSATIADAVRRADRPRAGTRRLERSPRLVIRAVFTGRPDWRR
jgi:hypothetical protein